VAPVTLVPLAAQAEAPSQNIIPISGPDPCGPVIVRGRFESLSPMTSIDREGEVVDVTGRSYLERARFCGPNWDRYIREGRRPDVLRSEQADQVGRFYLALRDAAPAIRLPGETPHLLRDALEILARHGVPTRLESPGAVTAD
jgi:hypothetical protein